VVSIITNTTTRTYFGAVPSQAAGTGIIVSSDGYILTNKHVVNSARSVQVITVDGVTYEDVAVVGTDPLNDVAYLKIKDGKDLPAATLGDSNTVRVGQSVVAIGNALGQYQNTVTSGIISGTGRPIQAGDESGNQVETLTDLLQTDAAINSGNSGGPLLNMAGQVIGINTAVAQDAQGIGFAIPINATKGTLKGVLAGNGVQRAYLGVRYVPITPEITKKYDLSVKQGAYVYGESTSSVISGSPADKGGIKEKDIITKINGAAVGRNGGVSSLVGAYAPGDTIGTTVVRDGSEKELRVTLGTYTD
jgi:serine protease Do